MSKKLWCRKCKRFEMHDSSSETIQAKYDRLKAAVKWVLTDMAYKAPEQAVGAAQTWDAKLRSELDDN